MHFFQELPKAFLLCVTCEPEGSLHSLLIFVRKRDWVKNDTSIFLQISQHDAQVNLLAFFIKMKMIWGVL